MGQPAGDEAVSERTIFAEDLLRGAAEISEFFYGDSSRANRRRIYHLAEQGKLPAFRMGGILCARQSTLINYVERQERQAIAVVEAEIEANHVSTMLHGTAGKN